MFASLSCGHYGACARNSAVALAVLGMLATSAVAQSRLGATDGRRPLSGMPMQMGAPPAADPQSADSHYRERTDLAARHLLDSAIKDIAEGRADIGQRVLELLIARYPDSGVVAEARLQLFRLYAATTGISSTAPAGTVLQRDAGNTPPPAAAPSSTATQQAGTRIDTGWRTSIISYRRLQDELRNSIGDRVFFSGGSAELGSRARAVIAAQAEWLMRRPDIEAVVEGHADDVAAGADNEKISLQRAQAVRDRLIAEGVDPSQVRMRSLGLRDAVALCGDSDCAAQNRRVVLLVNMRGAPTSPPPATVVGRRNETVDVRR